MLLVITHFVIFWGRFDALVSYVVFYSIRFLAEDVNVIIFNKLKYMFEITWFTMS